MAETKEIKNATELHAWLRSASEDQKKAFYAEVEKSSPGNQKNLEEWINATSPAGLVAAALDSGFFGKGGKINIAKDGNKEDIAITIPGKDGAAPTSVAYKFVDGKNEPAQTAGQGTAPQRSFFDSVAEGLVGYGFDKAVVDEYVNYAKNVKPGEAVQDFGAYVSAKSGELYTAAKEKWGALAENGKSWVSDTVNAGRKAMGLDVPPTTATPATGGNDGKIFGIDADKVALGVAALAGLAAAFMGGGGLGAIIGAIFVALLAFAAVSVLGGGDALSSFFGGKSDQAPAQGQGVSQSVAGPGPAPALSVDTAPAQASQADVVAKKGMLDMTGKDKNGQALTTDHRTLTIDVTDDHGKITKRLTGHIEHNELVIDSVALPITEDGKSFAPAYKPTTGPIARLGIETGGRREWNFNTPEINNATTEAQKLQTEYTREVKLSVTELGDGKVAVNLGRQAVEVGGRRTEYDVIAYGTRGADGTITLKEAGLTDMSGHKVGSALTGDAIPSRFEPFIIGNPNAAGEITLPAGQIKEVKEQTARNVITASRESSTTRENQIRNAQAETHRAYEAVIGSATDGKTRSEVKTNTENFLAVEVRKLIAQDEPERAATYNQEGKARDVARIVSDYYYADGAKPAASQVQRMRDIRARLDERGFDTEDKDRTMRLVELVDPTATLRSDLLTRQEARAAAGHTAPGDAAPATVPIATVEERTGAPRDASAPGATTPINPVEELRRAREDGVITSAELASIRNAVTAAGVTISDPTVNNAPQLGDASTKDGQVLYTHQNSGGAVPEGQFILATVKGGIIESAQVATLNPDGSVKDTYNVKLPTPNDQGKDIATLAQYINDENTKTTRRTTVDRNSDEFTVDNIALFLSNDVKKAVEAGKAAAPAK